MPERSHKRLDAKFEPKRGNKEQTVTSNGDVSLHKRNRSVSFAGSVVSNIPEQDSANVSSPPKKTKSSFLSKHGKKPPPNLRESQRSTTSTSTIPAKGAEPSLLANAQTLWSARKQLPVWAHSRGIRHSLRKKDVLLLSGATGSGKSTQVPQILLTEHWCAPGGRIAVTEPRRVAAISLARRVAGEMGSPLGSGGEVGYSVRFDSCVGRGVRVKFLTEGMLLREILRDQWLSEYAGVIVDEVHERGLGVDLVLGFLKRIVEGRGEGREGRRLKVCVMSATADMERLKRFFGQESEVYHEATITNGIENGIKGTSRSDNSDSALKRKLPDDRQSAPGNGLNGQNAQPAAIRTAKEHEHDEYSDWSGMSESDQNARDDFSDWSGFSASEDDNVSQASLQRSRSQPNGLANGLRHSPEYSETKLANGSIINGMNELNHDIGVKQVNSVSTDGLNGLTRHDEVKEVISSSTNGTKVKVFPTTLIDESGDPQVDICHIEGRQYPVKINYVSEPIQDILEASLKTIFQIHYKEPLPGDVLVFLTGQESVESLTNLVREYSLGLGPEVPKVLVLPLFAALPQAAQQTVFEPSPPKTRKIIISTNIAETSITVPGVRFVIDCGKAKVKHFRTSIGLESLLVKPISKSAAIQRKGRAGREAAGECYRLYTEKDYLTFDDSNTPEILRCDLSHPILTIRARGVSDVLNFPFLDQPPREAMEKALLNLWMLDALTDSGAITPTGTQIARFPLSVSLGRALLAAAEPDANCVLELIDIIACLSVENVFLQPNSEEKRDQAETARRELYKREGDHLTFLTTVQAYAAEDSDRKAWAERHFVSHRAMRAVMDVRKQLRALCQEMRILNRTAAAADEDPSSTQTMSPELSAAILKSFLKGFAMNTAALCPDGSYRTLVGKQALAIHPSSVLFGRKVEALVFTEFVYTKKSYARGVSAVQLDWVRERFPVD